MTTKPKKVANNVDFSKPVFNVLIPNANIAIVIDTPSADDCTKKALMKDKLAQQLIGKLATYGINHLNCSRLSIVQIRHTKIDFINREERLAWTALLERDLAKINPNVIVAVGELSLKVLTDSVNIEKYRGTPMKCVFNDAIVVPIEHYNTFYTNPAWQPLTDFYVQKIANYQHSRKFPWKDVKVHVTKDIDLLTREFLSDEFQNDPKSVLGFDIETSIAEVTSFGFAKSETEAYVIPFVHMPMAEFVPLMRFVDKLMRSKVRKIAQNGNFDITYMGHNYHVKVNNFWWDTMLAWHAIYPNLPKGIETISSVCTDEPYWKDDGKQWMLPYDQINWPQFFEYNGRDCVNLLTIQKVEEVLLAARNTEATFRREMDLCYPLISMELDGMNIDQSKVGELQAETGELIRKWQLFLDTLLEEEGLQFNVASHQQLKEFLYDKLKLPKRVYKGELSSGEDALLSLIPHNPYVVKPIMILKKLKKEYSEYKVKIAEDGRMRATFKPAGTMTGRLASSKSITGTGTNFQNRTKKIRVYFIPDNPEEEIIINADYSKAESWITAALSEDQLMLEALHGPDFHSQNATNILGKPVTKANYGDYQLGKRVSHGANYRMTAFLLQRVLLRDGYTFSKTETEELMEMYHRCYPNIRKVFHARIETQLNRNRTLVNPFGRKITFWNPWGTELLNSATAWIPQGTVGDMTNTGLINIYHKIPEVQLKIQVHDSIVMQTKRKYLNQDLIDRILDCMTIPLTINGIKITVPVDVEVGPNWLHLTDWKKYKETYELH